MNNRYYDDLFAWLDVDSGRSSDEKMLTLSRFPIPVDSSAAIKRMSIAGKDELLLVLTCMRKLWPVREKLVSACFDLCNHSDQVVRGAALYTLHKIAPLAEVEDESLSCAVNKTVSDISEIWELLGEQAGKSEVLLAKCREVEKEAEAALLQAKQRLNISGDENRDGSNSVRHD